MFSFQAFGQMLAYGIILPLLDTTLVSQAGLLPRIKDLYLSQLSVLILAVSFAVLALAPKLDFVFVGRSMSPDAENDRGLQRLHLTCSCRYCNLHIGDGLPVLCTVPRQLSRRRRYDRYGVHCTGDHGHPGDSLGRSCHCHNSEVEHEAGGCWKRIALSIGSCSLWSHDHCIGSSACQRLSFSGRTWGRGTEIIARRRG